MVSVSGISLMNGGMHHAYHHGRGIGRRVAGSVLNTLGQTLLSKVVRAISGSGYRRKTYRRRRVTSGSSYRLTGMGKRRKTYRKRRLIGIGRRTTRRTTRTTYHKRRTTTGGYRRVRRVGRSRISTVRKHRILII